jgi:ribose 5-phosphate isomerase B
VADLGAHAPESVDYPDFAQAAAQAIARGEAERAILICGSGVGMAMAANAAPGIRAVNGTDPYQAKMARRHNDANVLTLGARMVGPDLAYEITKAFLQEPFEGGRHQRRVDKIEALKKGR